MDNELDLESAYQRAMASLFVSGMVVAGSSEEECVAACRRLYRLVDPNYVRSLCRGIIPMAQAFRSEHIAPVMPRKLNTKIEPTRFDKIKAWFKRSK